MSLQEVLESTVQSVLDEGRRGSRSSFCRRSAADFLAQKAARHRAALFRRVRGGAAAGGARRAGGLLYRGFRRAGRHPRAGRGRAGRRLPRRRAHGPAQREAALLVTALSWLALLLDHFGVMPALFAEERLLSCLPFSLPSFLSASSDATCSFMPSSSSARGQSPMSCSPRSPAPSRWRTRRSTFLPARRARGPVPRRRHARHELCPAWARAVSA